MEEAAEDTITDTEDAIDDGNEEAGELDICDLLDACDIADEEIFTTVALDVEELKEITEDNAGDEDLTEDKVDALELEIFESRLELPPPPHAVRVPRHIVNKSTRVIIFQASG